MKLRVPSLPLILVIATALALSGCGRKGKLEPPPDQHVAPTNGKAQDPGYVKPKTSFILDPLLN